MTAQLFNNSIRPIDIISIINQRLDAEAPQPYTSKSFKKNEYIYLPHKHADQIYIVKEGRVKIGSHGNDGKELIKKIALKGELFGELTMIGQSTHKDYAITMEDTEVFILTTKELQLLMREDQILSLNIMQLLGNRLMEMEHRLEALVFRTSRNRIIDFLETLVNKRGQRIGYEMLVRKFFTHQEIANITATSRQTN